MFLVSNGFAFDFLFTNKEYADRITVQDRIASQVKLSELIANNENTLDNVHREGNNFLKRKSLIYLSV